MKHTKWRVDDEPLPSRGFVRVLRGDDTIRIYKKGRAKYYCVDQLDKETQDKINHIVKACNSHYEQKAMIDSFVESCILALNLINRCECAPAQYKAFKILDDVLKKNDEMETKAKEARK